MISLDELIIPDNRIRRTFAENEIESLAKSIESKGLIHPPTLREDCRTLLAGERRVRAMTKLHNENRPFSFEGTVVPRNFIPYNLAGELSETDLLEAELEENTIRVDLSWQDQSRAIAELHALRESQHGKFDPKSGEGWTQRNTAEEILGRFASGDTVTRLVKDSKVLADHLDDPEVAAAKSKKDALKIIERKASAAHNAKLAETFDTSRTPHSLILGDMQEILPTLEDNSFDVILTDPPYGVDAHKFGDMADAAHEYEDSPDYFRSLIALLSVEGFRVAKPQAHIYIFCDIRNFPVISIALTVAGCDVWQTPIIWDKGNVGMLPRPDYGPRRCYEAIAYAIKGDKKTNFVAPDVIRIPGIQTPTFGAEKPWELYHNLLARSVRPGATVLDPFSGAGPIIPACNALRCTATAIELNTEKHHHQLTRINECLITSSSAPADLTQLDANLSALLTSG